MPIIRNPFRKQDENVRAPSSEEERSNSDAVRGIDAQHKEPIEYQMSEVNDSGVFVPPSPEEKKSFWASSSSRSTTSSSIHRCAFDESEQFNISRESFDSYRRSFDISARSPIIQPEARPRASLDSRTFLPPPRTSSSHQRPLQLPQTQEEDRFEDVTIDDLKPLPAKKRGIFARMVDASDHSDANNRPASSHEKTSAWHAFGVGRKRGQSGQGAELGSFPTAKRDEAPQVEADIEPVRPVATKPPPQPTQQRPLDKTMITATVENVLPREARSPALSKGFESVPVS